MDLRGINLEGLSGEEIDNLLVELEKIVKVSPLDYIPHPKQKEFHSQTHKIRAIFGGNRSGKTEAGTLECWYHMSGEYPDWYPLEGRISGNSRGRIVISEYKNHGNVLEEKIRKWFPADRAVIKRMMGHIETITVRHKNGSDSVAEVLTHEQNDMAFESWSGHWAWFDEPPPREKFIATMRGLVDFKGRCWLTLTPLNEPWIFDEICTKDDGRRWHVVVSIYDNPYIKKEEIATFEATMDEDSKEARLYGKFRHLAGLVYKEFDARIHIVDSGRIKLRPEWPCWFVLDPADRRPHHGVWARCDPLGTLYIFDELVFKGTIKDTSAEILKREAMMGLWPDNILRVLDPNKGRAPSVSSGLTLVNEFAQHGLYFSVNVNDDVTTGHLAVKEKLSWDKSKEFSTTNCPKLYFMRDTTKECVRQLQAYVWDDWKGVSKGSRSEKEEVKDINKDMPDCIRYLVITNPSYYNYEGEKDPESWVSKGVTGYH